MSDQQVVYDMRLKDNLTQGVDGANAAVNKLESSLGGVKGLLEGIGLGLAAFEIGSFVHAANEEWEKMEFAMSQVHAAIESTGGAAGLTFDELKKGAEDSAHSLKFTQAEILGMQSVLLTFPSVTKQTFAEASSIIEDMSTRLGQDLKSSTIQLGKALQDPERGITALRRVGVNFNETQEQTIKNLVETNHAAEAQALILKELAFEFGGSAAAAAEADKSFRLDKTMEENRVALGELVDQIKEDVLPAMIGIANGFKTAIEWISKNKTTIKEWGMAIGAAIVVVKGAAIIGPIMLTVENALVAAATGATGFGAAMATALGPITLIAIAVGGLVLAFTKMRDAINEAHEARNEFLGISTNKEIAMMEELSEAYGGGQAGKDKAATEEKANLKQQRDSLQKELASASGQRAKEINDALTENLTKTNAVDRFQQNLIKKPATKAATTGDTEKKLSESKTKATGSKSVTINVTIQKLGETTINTTNIKEGMGKVKEMVVAALTGAVNDFQIVAGNS